MSEQPSRLNLIQRVMKQQAALAEQQPPKVDEIPEVPHAIRAEDVANADIPVSAPKPAAMAPQAASHVVRLNYAALRESRIVAPDDRRSVTYNEFRAIKRKLLPLARDKVSGALNHNLVMVSSTLPGEGKTFAAMNLAVGLAAESNLDVILVDTDVAWRSVQRYFTDVPEHGVLDLLTGQAQGIDDVLCRCEDLPNLHVLFCGTPNDAAPELFASKHMGEICEALSKRFPQSIVIFDTSPVLATAEPVALVSHVHQLIMVVAAGGPGRHQVEEALTALSSCPNIHLLFNKAPAWQRASAKSYYYGYYGEDQNPSQGGGKRK